MSNEIGKAHKKTSGAERRSVGKWIRLISKMIFGLNLAFVAYLAWAFAHAISAPDGRVMYSLATLILGIPASGIVFLLLYGYGSLVENVEGIREDVHALRKAGEEKTIRSK